MLTGSSSSLTELYIMKKWEKGNIILTPWLICKLLHFHYLHWFGLLHQGSLNDQPSLFQAECSGINHRKSVIIVLI